MHKGFLTLLAGLALAGAARAEVLTLPESEQPAPQLKLPSKGLSMGEMERQFGEPRQKRPTVGGGSPQQPPITRWDYEGYYVIFERDRIVDVVVPGAPPKIYNRDRLQPLSASAPAGEPAAATPETADDEAPTEPAAAAMAGEEAQPPAVPDVSDETSPSEAPADEASEPEAETLSPQVREAPVPGR